MTIWVARTVDRRHDLALAAHPALEAALFCPRGHVEFAEAFNDHDPSLRSSMIELGHGSA